MQFIMCMCIRNHWKNEIIGQMRLKLFDKLMDKTPGNVSRIFFVVIWGVSLPLRHSLYVKSCHVDRAIVEIITKELLSKNMIK